MAARRLLIVMLVLLGISTLAAALVPQSTLNDDKSTSTGTTTQTTTATTAEPPAGRSLTATITVNQKKPPVVVACPKAKPNCDPLHVGDQLTLLVYSARAAQLEIPKFGQFQFASPEAPAQFELLPTTPDQIGILFASTDRVAARVQVLSGKSSKRPARP
jgi:hypothetical protein